jgi:hypothetical protein
LAHTPPRAVLERLLRHKHHRPCLRSSGSVSLLARTSRTAAFQGSSETAPSPKSGAADQRPATNDQRPATSAGVYDLSLPNNPLRSFHLRASIFLTSVEPIFRGAYLLPSTEAATRLASGRRGNEAGISAVSFSPHLVFISNTQLLDSAQSRALPPQNREAKNEHPVTMSSPSPSSAAPTTSTSAANNSNNSAGPTSSPLLFFVALGFGVVFTNLW